MTTTVNYQDCLLFDHVAPELVTIMVINLLFRGHKNPYRMRKSHPRGQNFIQGRGLGFDKSLVEIPTPKERSRNGSHWISFLPFFPSNVLDYTYTIKS